MHFGLRVLRGPAQVGSDEVGDGARGGHAPVGRLELEAQPPVQDVLEVEGALGAGGVHGLGGDAVRSTGQRGRERGILLDEGEQVREPAAVTAQQPVEAGLVPAVAAQDAVRQQQ